MRTPGIVQRHPELGWLAAIGLVVAAVATVVSSLSGVFRTDSAIPATNPDQLVALVQGGHGEGYSGTVATHVDLDLPASVRSVLTGAASLGASLLAGSHTMRYWYGGDDLQRVAVIEPTAEQDVFRNGRQLLLWDTRTRTAQRTTLPAATGSLPLTVATPAALTPPQLASRLLDLAGPTSDMTLRNGASVADRSTYQLVIEPDSSTSRIGAVHIEVDGREAVPLSVQVYARGRARPVIDVSFTTVTFRPPASQNFSFTPPAGATQLSRTLAGNEASVRGAGWLSVTSYPSTAAGKALVDRVFQGRAKPVKGTWGAGRLLQSPLLSVLVTDKGQLLVGPVDASVLYKAVAK